MKHILKKAATTLRETDRGRQALVDLRKLLDHGAISLDRSNQQALIILLEGAFKGYTGTVQDLLDDQNDEQ